MLPHDPGPVKTLCVLVEAPLTLQLEFTWGGKQVYLWNQFAAINLICVGFEVEVGGGGEGGGERVGNFK